MERSVISGVRRLLEHSFWRVRAGRGAGSVLLTFGVALVLALALTMSLGMPGVGAARADSTPSPSSTGASGDTSAGAGTVGLTLAPDNSGTLTTAQDLGLTITLTNPTAAAVSTTVHVWLDRTRLTTRAELSAWLGTSASPSASGSTGTRTGTTAATNTATPSTAAPEPPTQAANSVAVDVTTGSIDPGTTATVRASIPAAQLGLIEWGAYGLEATAPVPGSTLSAASVVTWSVGAPANATALGVIMPLTVSPGVSGLLSAADLTTATAPGGVLTSKLDSVIGRPVTLAIDPMIIVSIRALGTAAPQSALDWLAKLAAATNPTFPLSYADADLSVQHQAGVPTLLSPTSFDYAVSASNFQSLPSPDPFTLPGQVVAPATATGATGAAAPTTAPQSATATPTPAPTLAPGVVPTTEELSAWNYTRTDIAWPAAATVSGSDLDYFAASGLTTSMLSSANVTVPDASVTPNAPVTIAGKSAVIVDAELSDALQAAVTANSEAPRDGALAEISAELAILTGQAGASQPALVASLGRAAPSSSFAVTHSLDTVEVLPWAAEVPLADVLSAPQTSGVTVLDSPESAERVSAVSSMLDDERQVHDFAPVIEKPELITGRQRANLLAVLNQAWLADTDGSAAAVKSYDKASQATLSSVQIVDGSTINLLATNGDVPIPISNDLDYPVTVTLQVTASNARLVVDPNRIDVTIEAHSQKTAKVPVKAVVATGQVDLTLQLFNQNGVLVSQAAPLEINVSADWEGIGTLIIGILAVLLLVFGVVRQILKRRRAKRSPEPVDETAPDAREGAAPAQAAAPEEPAAEPLASANPPVATPTAATPPLVPPSVSPAVSPADPAAEPPTATPGASDG